jgi:uncharacterized protein
LLEATIIRECTPRDGEARANTADVGGSMKSARIELSNRKIREFCRKWEIVEFSLFGSVLRDDFKPSSDVDVLVVFTGDPGWSLFDHVTMEQELSAILGRRANIVSRRALERSSNFIRRKAILETAERFYAAG